MTSAPLVAGVDEAGRGPLAGPVVAAAVILPEGMDLTDIDDSKQLDPATRERLAERILAEATWAIAQADPPEIDRLNILWATMAAMERAVAQLIVAPTEIWIDGNRVPPGLMGRGRAVIGGDGIHACIGAASILAKTHRDRLMREWHEVYPQYGFDQHFGYPTPDHLANLREHGPCPLHRRSFAPCQPVEQLCLDLAAN